MLDESEPIYVYEESGRWYVAYNRGVRRAFPSREEAEASARRAAANVGRSVRLEVRIDVSRNAG